MHACMIFYSRPWYRQQIFYFSYTPDTAAYASGQTPSRCIKEVHPRRGKFRSLPNDLFNRIQKVSLCCHLPPGTDSKHTCLQNRVRVKPEHTNSLRTSVATDLNSAPVVLGHKRAIKSNRMSRSTLILRERTVNTLPYSGRVTSITFERVSVECVPFLRYRVERIQPGDPIVRVAIKRDPMCRVCNPFVGCQKNRVDGITDRFVAMRTLMFPRGSNPSSWLINSSIVRCTSLSPPAPSSKRAPPTASISSKKMMQAFLLRAISNNSRTILAPSPTYFCTSSDPITRMKVASVRLATALAHSVFPVPGGPKSNTPLGGSIPRVTNRSG